ncbi:sigma-70 family RNA polymerase sigma factor [Aliiglaciecola sp. 3_MG-2023]|uniref:sigma-70 family RNA polymerase sigma factor n=1 Tax=Aliiglaciecola sp. 3_MG-2023 TaxID=3062644 RepID=UPI0026E16350|nr:sigma-70 family RNA polymerase sigma factor [Aliiglaciecola sp. 3_MG-2023]MDO6695224.1 sigma-70 family RNA polymerase sigma factor [Aliiglaciecola sp. 3_MG-2023]
MKCILQAIHDNESELSAFLRHRVSDAMVADDLLQEVKLRAVLQGQKFCNVKQPRAWLFRVTRNILVDHNRRRKGMLEVSTEISQPEHELEEIDLLSECVNRNLAKLTCADKEILEFCDLKNNTVKAYALNKAISLSAAKARLLRARQRLRDSIEVHCSVSFDENGKVCGHIKPK